MKEIEPQHYKKGTNRAEIQRRILGMWQSRIEAAGSMANFLEIWATRIIHTDIEIQGSPQIPRQRVEIRALVGEIKLP